MNYDTMSVDEWLQAFFMAATCDGITFVNEEEVTIDEIKSALRSAVIREASVGTGNFTGEYGIGMYGEYEPQEGFSVNVDGEHEPEIAYDLIPREAP